MKDDLEVNRDRRAAAERFLGRAVENALRVGAQLEAEGKTWEELGAETLKEVKTHRREQVERHKTQ